MKYKTLVRLLVRGFGLVMIAQAVPGCASTVFGISAQLLGTNQY